MTRPAARFVDSGERDSTTFSHTRERAATRLAVLALFDEPGVELYSVEVARAVGCKVERAAGVLKALERLGKLVSCHVHSPVSGNGRRIYRRVTP